MEQLLARSAELAETIAELLGLPTYDASARVASSRILCDVSFEHAGSVRVLLATGTFTSALGMLRMQYEALVKAIWALYSASESSVAKLQRELRQETAAAADRVPSLGEMLAALEGKAPWQATVSSPTDRNGGIDPERSSCNPKSGRRSSVCKRTLQRWK